MQSQMSRSIVRFSTLSRSIVMPYIIFVNFCQFVSLKDLIESCWCDPLAGRVVVLVANS